MINYLLRAFGLKVHIWTPTHRSGYCIRCVHCGERRSMYCLGMGSGSPSWWETTESGDGSCKHGTGEQKTRGLY